MVKPITRKANARGLDRQALGGAKQKVGMIALESSLTLSGDARKKKFDKAMGLLAEGSNIQREALDIRAKNRASMGKQIATAPKK